jgi:endo-1,4-beta-xylanase
MNIGRRDALKSLGGAAVACALPSCAATSASTGSLDALARRKGLRVGNAMGRGTSGPRANTRFEDPAYRALMARECSLIVAENETKWQAIQPRPGEFRFAAADEMFAWAKQEGMGIRGHTLVWQTPKWLPRWVNEHDFGANPRQEAERVISVYVKEVLGHFGRDIHSWDVVNEAIDPKTGEHRDNVLNQAPGQGRAGRPRLPAREGARAARAARLQRLHALGCA